MTSLETVLIYAKSGMTKTTQLYHLIKWLSGYDPNVQYTGKQYRIVTAELGNNIAPFEDSGMIDNKVVDIFDITGREKAFADVHRIAKGYWPRKIKGGGLLFETSEVCLTSPQKWEKIGGIFVEGFTSLANLWLNHSSDQVQFEGPNLKEVRTMGYKPSFAFSEDGLTITGSQPAHYGIVQKEIHKFYQKLSGLVKTNNVPYLVFTALEGRGDEDLVLKRDANFVPAFPIYGPKLVGTAYTSYVPSWFRHTLHLDKEKLKDKDGEVNEKIVAWFVNHTNIDTNINYLCKPRILPELYPELMKVFQGGYVQIGFKRGIDKYFETLEKLRKEFRGEPDLVRSTNEGV
jgi:hypothetical protein